MNEEKLFIVLGTILFSLGMLFSWFVLEKRSPDPEIINKHMQELAKSCVETHNGTFITKFMVGDTNQIEYTCQINSKK